MENKIACLFDLDGVIIDTEPQYDVFWSKIADRYDLGIPNFERVIKGTTVPNIMAKYFSHLPQEERLKIEQAGEDFDVQMDIKPIPGALEFLHYLKTKNIPMGLVTSSNDRKLEYVFSKINIKPYFNTIVSANRITQGKPHPMCYLLAAKDLEITSQDCIVFEDSLHGIESGNAAGMKVVGLYTTNPKEMIEQRCNKVIPDFLSPDYESLYIQL